MAVPLVLSNALTATIDATIEWTAEPAMASVASETLEAKIDRIAIEHGIPTTTLYNLAWSESSLNPSKDNGEDRGIVQINRKYWPEITDEQAFDPEFSLNFAASKIAKDEQYLWTVCNCYSFAKIFIKNLPKMADIQPNTDYPRVGGLVVFQYKVKHIAVVTKVTKEGIWVKEANFEACKTGQRLVPWDDKSVVGYWSNVE